MLPVFIPSSPLLSGTLADDLMTTLVARGVCNPLPGVSFSPGRRPVINSKPSPPSGTAISNKPLPLLPKPTIPPTQIIGLLNLLEQMDSDVTKELERLRDHIQELRNSTEVLKAERSSRCERVALRKDREEKETKHVDDEFWLNA